MDKDIIEKCIYLLTGDPPAENLTHTVQEEIKKYDKELIHRYVSGYPDIYNIINRSGSAGLTKKQRAEILLDIKNSLSAEDRKNFDKFIAILRIYLNGISGNDKR